MQRVWGHEDHTVNEALRLDPFALPAEITMPTESGALTVILDRERAMYRGRLPSGIPVAINMPTSEYQGVAARLVAVGTAGAIRVSLELLHRDPSLTVRLALADDPGDLAADWQAWGKAFCLPLLLITPDGKMTEEAGAPKTPRPSVRRVRRFLSGRRTRFAGRRKTGRPTDERIDVREITARN